MLLFLSFFQSEAFERSVLYMSSMLLYLIHGCFHSNKTSITSMKRNLSKDTHDLWFTSNKELLVLILLDLLPALKRKSHPHLIKYSLLSPRLYNLDIHPMAVFVSYSSSSRSYRLPLFQGCSLTITSSLGIPSLGQSHMALFMPFYELRPDHSLELMLVDSASNIALPLGTTIKSNLPFTELKF